MFFIGENKEEPNVKYWKMFITAITVVPIHSLHSFNFGIRLWKP